MDKLHIALDVSSYASIIGSLHSPLYKLCNEVDNEQIDNNNNNKTDNNGFYDGNRVWCQPSHALNTSKVNN